MNSSFITLAPKTYMQLQKEADDNAALLDSNPLLKAPMRQFMGLNVHSNPIFPYDQTCKRCDGTGFGGAESTYCSVCLGAGKRSIIGAMSQGASLTVLVDYYPPAFSPAWPSDHPVARRPLPERSDFAVEGMVQ